ncbi:MAG TPA: hypothetical protein VH325_05120 [Bryobacteraceae bacterium]|nr:hypothetical protein [Bryobacteraceae bacterium]
MGRPLAGLPGVVEAAKAGNSHGGPGATSLQVSGGQSVHREVESEGHEEKYRTVIGGDVGRGGQAGAATRQVSVPRRRADTLFPVRMWSWRRLAEGVS